MTRDEEEGTVVSTVRAYGDEDPIEVLERDDGSLLLRQGSENFDSILVDRSQLRKLWFVIGMHVEMMDLYDEVERPSREGGLP